MAGGIDWFRWHHGSVTDPKFRVVAKRAGSSVADAIAVWACLLEHACVSRGSIAAFDVCAAARLLDLPEPTVRGIVGQLRLRGMLVDARIAKPRRYFVVKTLRPSSGEWSVLRSAVFERDGYRCVYCGAEGVALECDHVRPVADGGGHSMDNLAAACVPCNRSKGSKALDAWRRTS